MTSQDPEIARAVARLGVACRGGSAADIETAREELRYAKASRNARNGLRDLGVPEDEARVMVASAFEDVRNRQSS